ncbi:MAG: hypothetical protein MJZ25_09645 [Fibrobacter sp.]|nr:hypothetical protein [Fibrobacter sp.]
MKKSVISFLMLLLICVSLSFGDEGASAGGDGTSAGAAGGVQAPFFAGGILGFGSGTGVGSARGVGLQQIAPVIGYWYPRYAYLRLGYGFSNFEEADDDDNKYAVDHSDFSVDLAVHAYGDLYIMGSYSRAKDLSDLGDVAWNEWGLGFGSVINVVSKTMFFAEMQYRWVMDHYDPFLDKNVNGTRLQFNLGFAVYVY